MQINRSNYFQTGKLKKPTLILLLLVLSVQAEQSFGAGVFTCKTVDGTTVFQATPCSEKNSAKLEIEEGTEHQMNLYIPPVSSSGTPSPYASRNSRQTSHQLNTNSPSQQTVATDSVNGRASGCGTKHQGRSKSQLERTLYLISRSAGTGYQSTELAEVYCFLNVLAPGEYVQERNYTGSSATNNLQPQSNEPSQPSQLIDPVTGKVMVTIEGGFVDPETGTFFQKVPGGAINSRTGEFWPTH